ncbi:unnamed protein product [Ostreobium quekettii]|uniref:Uncharacterized protein n=1 Tax=Ostreobium quekettii TaxID=121088 RepID=A0A8S1J7X9_9CHLO|nr:unnamed protein product [Ostreobium quekettii]
MRPSFIPHLHSSSHIDGCDSLPSGKSAPKAQSSPLPLPSPTPGPHPHPHPTHTPTIMPTPESATVAQATGPPAVLRCLLLLPGCPKDAVSGCGWATRPLLNKLGDARQRPERMVRCLCRQEHPECMCLRVCYPGCAAVFVVEKDWVGPQRTVDLTRQGVG